MSFSSHSPAINTPPDSICLLRLSALGDITHVLPVVRTLQHHWPKTRLTWVIGKTEYSLVKAIHDIEFIIFDKSEGFSAYLKLGKTLQGRHFDLLLHMQLSLRASVASLFIPASVKLGFDRARAKDMQALFTNEKIQPQSTRQHVIDSFLEFPRHFGLEPVLSWALPVNASSLELIKKKLNTNREILVINPCAVAKSRNWRNWTVEGYAAVADYARQLFDMQVVLSGGPTTLEKETADAIVHSSSTNLINLVGQTSLDELVALLDLADIVIAPDTGPVHIASALGTPTIGLYATTNPQRAGPYNFLHYVVNKYPQALKQYNQLDSNSAPWGERVKTAEAMKLISVEDVMEKLVLITEQNMENQGASE